MKWYFRSGIFLGHRTLYSWLCIAGITALCVGCGPVDLKKLKPTIWKPTAYVLVGGVIPGWTPGGAKRVAENSGVVTKAVYTPQAELLPRLSHASSIMPQVGLFIVASVDPMPTAINQWARAHQKMRLEWVGDGYATNNANNVRQLSMNQTAVSYLLGWLATEAAMQGGSNRVGWDLVPTKLSSATVKAALGGGFVANSKASNIPASIAAFTPGQASSTLSPLPKWVVVNYDLNQSQWTAAEASSCHVVSLVPQSISSPALAAQPGLPDASAITRDLSSFAAHKWKGGRAETTSGTWVQLGSAFPTASISGLLSAQESIVASDPSWAKSAFAMLPQTLQQADMTGLSIG